VLDETTIVKMYRRVAVGTNPDLELARQLTAAGFDHIPTHLGEITYGFEEDDEPRSIDLGLAQTFLPDAKEGWTHALERLHELYDAADPADVREDFAFLTEERGGDFLAEIEALGDATGALHVALSREENDPAFTPEAVDEWDLKEWTKSATTSLERLLGEGVGELRPYATAIRERNGRLEDVEDRGFMIRIHGDYHLGQVLQTTRGWMILDFEGEPARSLEERRAKHTPLRDVAGMLRSFSYAAVAALFQRADPDTGAWTRLSPWATTWERLARERFLNGYLTKSHEGHFLPSDREDINVLLDVLEIDKALYELGYERGHRPEWVRIPLRGIAQIAERGDGE
jgi:maltose alpha-D-glucosyltransferase/alpha-amylase